MYIDVAVMPVPTDKMDAYKKLLKASGKAWIKAGALQYSESAADDVPHGKVTDFYRSVKVKEGETVVVAVIVTKNRKHRDEVFKKVMSDPALAEAMKDPPFDGKRMIYGGFKPLHEAVAKE